MARPFEFKLSGWVKDSYVFDDVRFIELIDNKGTLGYVIYDILRCLISSNHGYYATLNDSLIASIHRKLGKCSKGLKHVKETILYFGKVELLDPILMKKNKILTSTDIQVSWLKAKSVRRARIPVDELLYWKLDQGIDCPSTDNCSNNEGYCNNNEGYCTNNEGYCNIDKTRHDSVCLNTPNNNTNNTEFSSDSQSFDEDNKLDDLSYYENKVFKDIDTRFAEEPLETNKYTPMSIMSYHASKSALEPNSDVIQGDFSRGYMNITNGDMMNCLKWISSACMDYRSAKYGKYTINYRFFRAFISECTMADLRTVFNLVVKASGTVTNREYYLRGVIVQVFMEKKIKALKAFDRKANRSLKAMANDSLERCVDG